ncbi:MAG: crosslink repair DNA glycosylase YcaQ family protein [Candidatus Zixiibacteriota bacterium]
MKISSQTARRIAINAQLLDGRVKLAKGKEGAVQAIEMLGYVQIDSMSVIQRAHHHTLWTRLPDYDPVTLHELHAIDRRVFEYFGHALSYLPMKDFRFYLPRMHRFDDPYSKWEKERLARYGHLMKPVLKRFRQEGALGLSDFTPPETLAPGERNPNKAAIELLQLKGDIFVSERRPSERVFDLAERVIPGDTDMRVPDDDELGRFLVRRALNACGVATVSEIEDHIRTARKNVVADALRELQDSGEVATLRISENGDTEYFALSDSVEKLARLRKMSPRLHLMSPFDNLIIQRSRISQIFDFDYSLECYVTPAKRKFGYLVHPILWDEMLIGRLDPKADRKRKALIIRNLMVERMPKDSEQFLSAFAAKLSEFARFNDSESLEFDGISPEKIRRPLERLMKNLGLIE